MSEVTGISEQRKEVYDGFEALRVIYDAPRLFDLRERR